MKIQITKQAIRLSIASVALSLLAGCSWLQIGESDYGCKGMPDGVTCKSAREVYGITENDDFRKRIDDENAAKAARGEIDCPECKKKGEQAAAAAKENPEVVPGEKFVVPRPARNPLPIRTQATVMRIWVAPWESEDGDLNVPGYMYTEIEPRRWEVGVPAAKPTPSLRPLEVSQPKTQPAAPASKN